MNLRETLLGVLKEPTSIQARFALARALVADGWLRAAQDMILASVRASARVGDFFSGLAMARLYLQGKAQDEALERLAARFCRKADREQEPVLFPVMPVRRRTLVQDLEARLPSERYALVQKAYAIGVDISMVPRLPEHELPNVPIFHELQFADFVTFAKHIEPLSLHAGTELIRQGQCERAFYLLSHGTAVVEQERSDGQFVELATVEAPTYVGEMSLLTDIPHRATVYVTCESMAWRIASEDLLFLAEKQPAILEQLQEIIRKRYLENLLKVGLSAFQIRDHDTFHQLFRLRIAQPAEVLFCEGDPSPGLFVILHGEAHARSTQEGYRGVDTLGEGDIVGEYSLLMGLPAQVTVSMPLGGLLLHLPVEDYASLRQQIPDLERALQSLLAQRLGHFPELIDPLDDFSSQRDSRWILPNAQSDAQRTGKSRS